MNTVTLQWWPHPCARREKGNDDECNQKEASKRNIRKGGKNRSFEGEQ